MCACAVDIYMHLVDARVHIAYRYVYCMRVCVYAFLQMSYGHADSTISILCVTVQRGI